MKHRDILISTITASAAGAISGDPPALASALRRRDGYARGLPLGAAQAHPSTAQMMIMNPLSGGGLAAGLFGIHPSTEDRVRRLLAIT